MAAAVSWSVLEAVIAPHYLKEGPQGGRPSSISDRRDVAHLLLAAMVQFTSA
jgi:hypothetical protein